MDPDEVPTLKGREGFLAYCHELGAVCITPWRVKTAVEKREVEPHQPGRALWFSRAEVHRWLDSLKQPVPRMYTGANTGREPKSDAAQ